jgi:integrase
LGRLDPESLRNVWVYAKPCQHHERARSISALKQHSGQMDASKRCRRLLNDGLHACHPALSGTRYKGSGIPYTSHLIVGLELDAATTSKLAGHANPNVTMRVYADDFCKTSDRNAAVLARAAERGFGT